MELAKRASKADGNIGAGGGDSAEALERRYVSLDEAEETPRKPKRAATQAQTERGEAAAVAIEMKDVFGPGGMLERSLFGGYEHRPAQLEMAELVHDAFQTRHHAIVEAGTGTGKTLAYLLPAICSGRRVVISTATKSLQEQLYTKDSVSAKTFCAESEGCGDEGPRELLVQIEDGSDGGFADVEGHGRAGRLPANQRLGQADRNGRPDGVDFLAGRFGTVGADRCAAGYLHRAELPGIQTMFSDRDARAGEASRPNHRESPLVLCRPGAKT